MIKKKPEVVIERFDPEISSGLTAEQVKSRKAQNLLNNLKQPSGKSYLSIFLGNIFTYFNILCFIIAAALLAVGAIKDLFFLAIITANVVIGIAQEIKAKSMICKLKIMAQGEARLVREGQTVHVPIAEIALDDIVMLTTGNQVSTDCIIKEGTVDVNESMLTGESESVRKNAGDMLFGGSYIALGTCYARVEHIKEDNFVQKLTVKAKKYNKPKSEILRTLSVIIRIIGIAIIPLAVVMVLHNYRIAHNIVEAITRSSGSVIGMIPAGLFLLTSTTLVVGIIKLAKRKCLVQDMYCIEMLARVNVLCLDKTGTITDGKMQVQEYFELELGKDYASPIISSMLRALNDNNFTSIAMSDHFGLQSFFRAKNILPFRSENKYSAVEFEDATYVFGAPEFIMKERGEALDQVIHNLSSKGLRVLLFAKTSGKIEGEKVVGDFQPLGLVTLSDNIRENTLETVEWFKKNEVAIKVISGDNPLTVSEVAKRAGIENADKWISLEGMSATQVFSLANEYTVFGRVTPEQKAILIKAIKAAGNTTAMTGDGVNDILALKEADCAIAMAAGSDAAKNVSHLVLMDSKFSSMPKVVEEGRKVINNISRASSLFIMKTIFSILLTVIILCSPGTPYPFRPSFLIIMEVCVIGFPSFVLALEPNTERIKGRFLTQMMSRAIPAGLVLLLSVVSILIYTKFIPASKEEISSMCVLSLTFVSYGLLVDLCLPINAIRLTLLVLAGAVGLAILFWFPELIGLVEFTSQDFLIVLIIILASYPLGQILRYGSRYLFSTLDERKAKRERELRAKTRRSSN